MEDSIEAHERAYRAFVSSGNVDGAVMSALYHFYDYINRGEYVIGAGSLARAERLAERIPDSAAAGYVRVVDCGVAYHAGDVERCLETAKRISRIGEDNNDPTLVTWGLHWEGIAHLRQGRLDQGWALVTESPSQP